jgi:hypothetical protein
MDATTTRWLKLLSFSSIGLALAQLAPLGMVTTFIIMVSLMISPTIEIIQWIGKSMRVETGKSFVAILALVLFPLVCSIIVGTTGATQEQPEFETQVIETIIVTISASIVLLTSSLPETAMIMMAAAVVLPFVRSGTELGSYIHNMIRGTTSVTQAMNVYNLPVAIVSLLFVILVSFLSRNMSLQNSSIISDVTRNSLPIIG